MTLLAREKELQNSSLLEIAFDCLINGTNGLSINLSTFYYEMLKRLCTKFPYTYNLYSTIINIILLYLLNHIFIHLSSFISPSYYFWGMLFRVSCGHQKWWTHFTSWMIPSGHLANSVLHRVGLGSTKIKKKKTKRVA